MKSSVTRIVFGAIALLVMAAPMAMANTRSYNWEMNNRYDSGKNNGVFHQLNSGSLTHAGSIWAYSRDGGSNPSPATVTVRVYKSDAFADTLYCTKSITPSTTLGTKKNWSQGCGSVPTSSNYYLEISKVNDDGWNERGSGSLTT